MNELAGRRLSHPDREVERARTQRAILRDRLADERGRAADLWVRALVAETPLADQAFRRAREKCRRIQAALAEAERRLDRLERETVRA